MLEIVVKSDSDFITSRWCLEQVKATLHFLLYHRMQIPVPFPTLGVLVNQFQQLKNDEDQSRSFFLNRQRSLANEAYESVHNIVDLLETHLISRRGNVQCAAIVFGPTPVLAKEVYFIKLPTVNPDHISENHLSNLQRTVAHTILSLVTDSRFTPFLNAPLPLTNVHVMIKVDEKSSPEESDDSLNEISWFQVPKSCKSFLIDLETDHEKNSQHCIIPCSCIETEIQIYADQECGLEMQCNQMTIRDDVVECETVITERIKTASLSELSSGKWLQLKTVVQGFKDVLSNGQKIWAC